MTKTLSIEGMGCQMCVKKVTAALEALEGVSAVSVSLESKSATLEAPETLCDTALKSAVEAIGFDVTAIA